MENLLERKNLTASDGREILERVYNRLLLSTVGIQKDEIVNWQARQTVADTLGRFRSPEVSA